MIESGWLKLDSAAIRNDSLVTISEIVANTDPIVDRALLRWAGVVTVTPGREAGREGTPSLPYGEEWLPDWESGDMPS